MGWFTPPCISKDVHSIKYDGPDPDALRMLMENIRGLINDARNANVKVAIATFAHGLDEEGAHNIYSDDEKILGVPALGKWFVHLTPHGARKSFPIYNRNVRILAAEEHVPMLDLANLIPGTPEYHTDWCHLTVKGHEAIAGFWAPLVQQAGWLD